MTDTSAAPPQLELTANIVAAFVGKNHIPPAELPALIETIHASLGKIATGVAEAPAVGAPAPAVPIKKSVTNGHIVCLKDGLQFKSLKRHLHAAHNLSPTEYRAKWGLKGDYPMVAPAYAATRSKLAKSMGLGHQPSEPVAAPVLPPPPAPATPAKKTRGRPKAV
jgi:predicted transcriptional regulator